MQRSDVAVHRGALLVGDGVEALNLAHHRNLVAVELARQITRYTRPRIAAVGALEHDIGGEVQCLAVVRTDEKGGIPVPAPCFAVNRFDGLDVDAFAGFFVKSLESAVLCLGVHNVGVGGVHLRFKTVARLGHVPIAVDDAAVVDGLAWASE